MPVSIYKNDVPENLDLGNEIAVDTETMGLKSGRDRLCLVQIADAKGTVHLIQIEKHQKLAKNLEKIMTDENVLKIFHYARFDIGVLYRNLNFMTRNIYCTKIASKLARTFSQSHGLKNLVKEILGIDISKEQQSSYWGTDALDENQINYAKKDVLYLHQIKQHLDNILKREDRYDIFEKTCHFLPTRCELDNMGWEDIDPFSH
ncbi:ribonuclease H-like domain-containing protein [Paracoccaceae bacterium]|nr:ribonuclease H-like domain-containing protein [Paracoccaceae bacterium]